MEHEPGADGRCLAGSRLAGDPRVSMDVPARRSISAAALNPELRLWFLGGKTGRKYAECTLEAAWPAQSFRWRGFGRDEAWAGPKGCGEETPGVAKMVLPPNRRKRKVRLLVAGG